MLEEPPGACAGGLFSFGWVLGAEPGNGFGNEC